ncbi:MAG: alpha/beta fold hydrolase [Rhodospirillaceae bacterium]
MTLSGRRQILSRFGAGALMATACALGLGSVRTARAQNTKSSESSGMALKSSASEISVKRGYTECRFGQLHFIRGVPTSGRTEKPPLVLLHQNPSSSVEYEPLIKEMAMDREVVAFDTPGNGMSDWPPEPMDMTGYATAFADGIESLNLGGQTRVDVFGFHTGSFLAAELAIGQPQKVGRLVMSGIPFRTPEERLERLADIEARPRITEDGKDIMGQLERLWTFVVSKRDRRVPLERAAEVFVEKAKPLDRYWWPYRGVWTYDVAERFPLISQPTLIVQPHENLLEYSKQAAAFISNVRMVELPDLERDVFDVGADQIAEKLRAFLS